MNIKKKNLIPLKNKIKILVPITLMCIFSKRISTSKKYLIRKIKNKRMCQLYMQSSNACPYIHVNLYPNFHLFPHKKESIFLLQHLSFINSRCFLFILFSITYIYMFLHFVFSYNSSNVSTKIEVTFICFKFLEVDFSYHLY